jgi:3'(2'), 5'-bisphosphate nucleotidase
MTSYSQYASEVLYIAKKAAELIMGYYSGKIEVLHKEDNSPVTEADFAANEFIKKRLNDITPDIPVVSEENSEEENRSAASGSIFWMVDPLDGTKSYIKKTGEFTVNIALIHNCLPQGGVVYIPAKQTGYFTAEDGKSYRQIGNNLPQEIKVRPKPEDKIVVVASKSHMTQQTEEYIASLGKNVSLIAASSSLKFCMIAEGSADIYPRFGNTMEWDTAAGHAILVAAGGYVEYPDGSPLLYRKEGFLNPFFIAKSGT